MRLEIPEATPSLNKMLRRHWSVDMRLKKHWHKLIWVALFEQPYGPPVRFSKAKVTITRCSPRMLDPDNAAGSVKHVVDALRACDVIADDTPEHIELIVKQEKGRARTVIELEAA